MNVQSVQCLVPCRSTLSRELLFVDPVSDSDLSISINVLHVLQDDDCDQRPGVLDLILTYEEGMLYAVKL